MKSKTRYNIKVAQKHGVLTRNIKHETHNKDIEEFLRLVKVTAKRDGITPHPDDYYRKMFETIPAENLKLYVAEYNNKIIASNIVIFYGNTATYLHGASDNEFRNVMSPYLLQWQAIKDAKKAGIMKYDFGGVKKSNNNAWSGITKFKTGFSPNIKATEFPGSYDIVLDNLRYSSYRFIQALKSLI
jgi:peptidoglycan pentaglycine glycine transferase (the first glycine)